MNRRPGSVVDPTTDVDYIFQNAFGIPKILDTTPSTAQGQLEKHGDSGFDGSNLFLNLNGTTYKISLTAV